MKQSRTHWLIVLVFSGSLMACVADEGAPHGPEEAQGGSAGSETSAAGGQGGAGGAGAAGGTAPTGGASVGNGGTGAAGGAEPVTICIPQSQLIAINEESSFWPECSPKQMTPKGSVDKSAYIWAHICSEEYVVELNRMLCSPSINLCKNDSVTSETRHRFLAQMAYETGYYTTLGQPIDDGSGLLHMIPANWQTNVEDMEALFPGEGILAHYQALSSHDERRAFFREPRFGWKSAAAWMVKTNAVIPGCGQNLLDGSASYDRMTQCIFGSVGDRSEAYDLTGKHLGGCEQTSD